MKSTEYELHLRRLSVEEALPLLDQYLNDAFLSGKQFVHIVHGTGTGTMRQVVREQLHLHPLVRSYRPGELGEGGSGVTVAELVDR